MAHLSLKPRLWFALAGLSASHVDASLLASTPMCCSQCLLAHATVAMATMDPTQEGSTRCTQSPHPTMRHALGRLQDSMHAVENSKMQHAGSSFKIATHNLCAMHQVVCEQGGDAHNCRLDHDA
ncbi:hypothetical protein B0H10DRAFT_1952672 [Mycena sp. CBHHK59/15]|nr:hypothetical protein B0H10DRAFT_1952672 [Mycena sp. CBHHK59/15]